MTSSQCIRGIACDPLDTARCVMASEEVVGKLTNLFTKLQDLIANGQGVSKKAIRVIEDSRLLKLPMLSLMPNTVLARCN